MSSPVGMSSHQRAIGAKDEWLTPPDVLRALGPFDLGPCAPVVRPWPTAERHYTIHDDGLSLPWAGRVWLNPPYGTQTWKWLSRLAEHGSGTALVFARTETDGFFNCGWVAATAALFLRGRLTFHHASGAPGNGNAGAPSVLLAYGESDALALANSGLAGALVTDWKLVPEETQGVLAL